MPINIQNEGVSPSSSSPRTFIVLCFWYLSGQPLKIVWNITLIPPNAHRRKASWSQASVVPSVISAFQSMLFVVHVADFVTATCWICDETQMRSSTHRIVYGHQNQQQKDNLSCAQHGTTFAENVPVFEVMVKSLQTLRLLLCNKARLLCCRLWMR